MVSINEVGMPLEEQSGVLVLEDPSGHQSWALIVDATVEYGDAEFRWDEHPQMKVIATMKPGELLRMASTEEPGEENVLVYSRMLVHVLREERDRYAELEKELVRTRRERAEAIERRDDALADRDEDLHEVWADGASSGYGAAMGWMNLADLLKRNPYPLPDDEEDECHIDREVCDDCYRATRRDEEDEL